MEESSGAMVDVADGALWIADVDRTAKGTVEGTETGVGPERREGAVDNEWSGEVF